MADEQTQRSYRLNEPVARRAPITNPGSTSDPLAELARLIGQADPFAEFGRGNVRRAAAPPPPVPPPAMRSFDANDYFGTTTAPDAHPVALEAPPPPPPAPPPSQPRQPYAARDLYPAAAESAGHPPADVVGYAPDPYHPSNDQFEGEDDHFYEDAPTSKSRMGILAIAAVFALAVLGTAGAFGYRAVFGTSRSSTPPPVIKADTAPSKIMPATASKAPSKLITDRVTDHDEKLVSREEKPVAIRIAPPIAGMPAAQASAPPDSAPPATGNGIISSEPKKIHTIAIRPDQLGAVGSQPAAVPQSPQPQAQVAPQPPARPAAPLARAATSAPPPAPAATPEPARQAEARAAVPLRHTESISRSEPLSLSPNAPGAPAAARAPVRTAVVAPQARVAPAATALGGGYAVQVSSQRSEAEAQASFRSLQAKFPKQLGGRQASIHRVELGAKGTYYRAMVGPFANANEASELCSGLKAAGGQCLIQRN
jgi:hypothetical protein